MLLVLAAALAVFVVLPTGAGAVTVNTASFTASNKQAGSHPDLGFSFTRNGTQSEDISSVNLELPPGAFANPEAVPTKCTVAVFNTDKCTDAQQVGTLSVDITAASILPLTIPGAIYVLSPNATDTATLGLVLRPDKICILFVFCAVPQKVFLQTNIKLSTWDTETGLRTFTKDAPKTTTVAIPPIVSASNGLKLDITIEKMTLNFQGKAGKAKTGPNFMLASSSCTPSVAKIAIITTQGNTASPNPQPSYTPTGCPSVPFNPAYTFAPTVANSGAPAGANFAMTVPAADAPIQNAAPKIVDIDFPVGSALNAEGLNSVIGCTETQLRALACPAASELGTASSNAPYLPPQLTGKVYAMAPVGTSVPLGIVLNGARGSLVIFRGTLGVRGDASAGTGRVYARFDAIPQLPYADVKVNISKLIYKNPTECGVATSSGTITGYNGTTASGGNGTAVARSSAYTVTNCLPKPTPIITSGPANPSTQTQPTFAFKAQVAGADLATATFQCSLDGAEFTDCSSPKTITPPLSNGSHTFQVHAFNGSQRSVTPASVTWTVNISNQFTVTPTISTTSTLAATHPDLTTNIAVAGGQPKSVQITLAAGFNASLTAATPCPVATAAAGNCGPESLIGSGAVTANVFGGSQTGTGNVYLTTAQDPAADAGGISGKFDFGGTGTLVLQGGAYLVNNAANQLLDFRNVPNSIGGNDATISNINLTFNGIAQGKPFLTNPSNCSAASAFTSTGKAYDGTEAAVTSTAYQATGCTGATAPAFAPTVNQAFTNLAAANSTAIADIQRNAVTADVDFPTPSATTGNGTIKRMIVKEPAFLGVNTPGLGADADQCPTTSAPSPIAVFNPAGCPAQSRVGQMTITTPLLSTPLVGDVYLVQASPIPWLGVKFSQPGISFSLLGVTGTPEEIPNCTPDESPTGFCNKQVTVDFNRLPDVPFSHVTFKLGTVSGRVGVNGAIPNEVLKNAVNADPSCISPGNAVATITSHTAAVQTRSQSIALSGCTFVSP
jgi:hypothetical protein